MRVSPIRTNTATQKGKKIGTIGHIGTFSFYPAHHLTMGEGGAVVTNDPQLYKIIMSFRDWGRDCCCPPGKDGICNKCAGNMFHRMGITNIGVACSQIPSTLKNKAMKLYHNSVITTCEIDPMRAFGLRD